MPGPEYIFMLRNPDTGLYYYWENDILKTQATPKALSFSPDNWDKLYKEEKRNMSLFGVARTFSSDDLGFVYDGAEVIRELLLKAGNGIEAGCTLEIYNRTLQIDGDEYVYLYKYLHGSELDFSTCRRGDSTTGYRMDIKQIEGGPVKLLANKINNEYEIPCDKNAPGAVGVYMDGIKFVDTLKFTVPEITSNERTYAVPLVFINEDGDSVGIYKSDQLYEKIFQSNVATDIDNYVKNSQNYFFSSQKALSIDVSGKITLKNDNPIPNKVSLFFSVTRTLAGNPYHIIMSVCNDLLINGKSTVDIPTVGTINLVAGDKLFLLFNNTTTGGFFTSSPLTYVQSDIFFKFKTRYDASVIYGRTFYDVFAELTAKMSDSVYEAVSDLLKKHDDYILFSGDAVRGLDGAVIKTTMQKFFNSANTQFNIGMETTDTGFVIQDKAECFKYDNPVHLGKTRVFKWSIRTDLLAIGLKIGYPNQSNSSLSINGKQDFNCTQIYNLPFTRISNILSIVSDYRADCYGMEFLRISTDGKDTSDTSSDNSVFIARINRNSQNPDGSYNLYRVPYISLSGLIAAEYDGTNWNSSVFNLEGMTPKSLLLKHGNFLRSICWGRDNKNIEFSTGDKNYEVKKTYLHKVIQENANQAISKLDAPLFYPIQFEIESELGNQLLDANADCYSFEDEFGQIWKGFPVESKIPINGNDVATFTLLAAPDNDLNKLP